MGLRDKISEMDWKEGARCVAYGAATAIITYEAFSMGSDMGYNEGLNAARDILNSEITEQTFNSLNNGTVQANCRIIGGYINTVVIDIVGLSGLYVAERVSRHVHKGLKNFF